MKHARLLGSFALFFLLGCAHRSQPSATITAIVPDLSPGTLLPVSSLGFEFMWRQRVTAQWEDQSESFDAVLQVHGGTLSLIGLSPLGTSFVVTFSEDRVELDNRSGRRLPFPPEYIIADIQRVFFPWLPPPRRAFSGTRSGTHQELTITEIVADGVLRERSFFRSDAVDRGEFRVTYEDWLPGNDAPARAVIHNEWFGYRLTIVTVDQKRLESPSPTSHGATR